MIKFSVIIPLYNKEKEIVETIDSVLQQTYKADEIIVVNDGSIDRGAMVVTNSFGNKIKLLDQKNCGVSCARNRGIEEARNEYLCFLDADDLWERGFLEEMKKLVIEFPEAIVYSTPHKMIDEKGKNIKSKVNLKKDFRGYLDDFIVTFKKNYGVINSSSVCIKKSANPSFPQGEKKGEDICTWLELSLKGRFAFVNNPLSIYKLNASNRSNVVHKEPTIPCQLKWMYQNKERVTREIVEFVHSNMLITCYGMSLDGDMQNVKAIISYMKERNDRYYFKLLPALFFPSFLLKIVKSVRRSMRHM